MKMMKVNFWLVFLMLLLPVICFGADDGGTSGDKQRVTIDMEDLGYVVGVILLAGTFLKRGLKWFPNDLIPALTWLGGAALYLGLSDGWGELRQWLAALMAVASATGLHSASTSTWDAAKSMKVNAGAGVLILFASFVFGSGCASPVQVKAGSDPIVVHAEWLAENGANALDQFLAFEDKNHAALPVEVRQWANEVRDDVVEVEPGKFVPRSVFNLRTATKVYQADKSAANGDNVKATTAAMLSLVNDLRGYMNLPPLVLPAAQPSVRDQMLNAPTNGPNQ